MWYDDDGDGGSYGRGIDNGICGSSGSCGR